MRFRTHLGVAIGFLSCVSALSFPSLSSDAGAQGRRGFLIRVLSEDRNEPIAGADLAFRLTGFRYGTTWHETTDAAGSAYFRDCGDWTFEIRHADFEPVQQSVSSSCDGPPLDTFVTVHLKRKAGRATATVSVTLIAEDDKLPVAEALVTLKGPIFTALFVGHTDASGRASITVEPGGDYEVEITHSKFESIYSTVAVKRFADEERHYELQFAVKRKRPVVEQQRTLRVTVLTRDESGNMVPVTYADVNLEGGQFHVTDRNGQAEFKHNFPPGESIKVDVVAKGYAPASGTALVRSRGSADELKITLEKRAESKWTGRWMMNSEWELLWRLTEDVVVEISGSAEAISAVADYQVNDPRGFVRVNESWSACQLVEENQATCTWSAEMEDEKRWASRKGTITIELIGDATIHAQIVQDHATIRWKSGGGVGGPTEGRREWRVYYERT